MNKFITILLIDDDEDDRELFELALKEADPKASYAAAGTCMDALEILNKGQVKPDYIFLDLNMPEMNGKECLSELKSSLMNSSIPVVIFSTSADPGDMIETKRLGAVGFVTKPSKITELTGILRGFINPVCAKQ